MTLNDRFDSIFSNLALEHKIKLFLLTWNEGKFQNELKLEFSLNQSSSIKKVGIEFNKLGFMEIKENKARKGYKQKQTFYYMTEINLKNIFEHICRSSNVKPDYGIFQVLKEDRKNYKNSFVDQVQKRLTRKDEFYNKMTHLLLDKSISYFFIFILQFGNALTENKKCIEFFNNSVLKQLLSSSIMSTVLDALKNQETLKLLSNVNLEDDLFKFFTYITPQLEPEKLKGMIPTADSVKEITKEFYRKVVNEKETYFRPFVLEENEKIEAIGYLCQYRLKKKLHNSEQYNEIRNLSKKELAERMSRVYHIFEQILFQTIVVESSKSIKINGFEIHSKKYQ